MINMLNTFVCWSVLTGGPFMIYMLNTFRVGVGVGVGVLLLGFFCFCFFVNSDGRSFHDSDEHDD